jgi:flagellar hook-basal body complex protein FliE
VVNPVSNINLSGQGIVPVDPNAIVSPANVNAVLRTDGAQTLPFQQCLDQAVEALQGISQVEFKANDLTMKYAQGSGSVEDVVFANNQLSLSMALATSVVNTSVQTFKEILQTQV